VNQCQRNLLLPDVLVLDVVVPTVEVKQLGRFDPRPEASKAL